MEVFMARQLGLAFEVAPLHLQVEVSGIALTGWKGRTVTDLARIMHRDRRV
jgi:hypothetical protein